MNLPDQSCKCTTTQSTKQRGKSLPYLLGIIIAILPKCPFCVLAYSGAITLCSGASISQHTASWSSWISISLSILILGILFINYKGMRTLAAIFMVIMGGFLISWAELVSGVTDTYYLGSVLVFMGVWVNGSLLYFLRQWGLQIRNLLQTGKSSN